MSNTWAYFEGAGFVQWLHLGVGDEPTPVPYSGGPRFWLHNVHSALTCKGRECIIHSPKPRDTDDWPLLWRQDRGIFERICPCGIGHPDAAQFEYWKANNEHWQWVHGCCRIHCTGE